MKIVLWAVFISILFVLWAREILAFGEARRERPDNHKREELRLRRRTLGLVVLFFMAVFYDLASVIPFPAPQYELAWLGISLILFVWLLIIAVRDMRDLSQSYTDHHVEMTLETLMEIEENLRRSGNLSDDDRRIPPVVFDQESASEPGPESASSRESEK